MKLGSWLPFGAVTLISVAVFGFGYWLALDAASRLNRSELGWGLAIMGPGALLITGLLVRLLNLLPSERNRLEEYRKRNRPAALSYRIKKMERMLRHLNFMKRNPSVVFLFFLFALILFGAMATAPLWNPHSPSARGCMILGTIFGCGYVLWVALFLRLQIMNR